MAPVPPIYRAQRAHFTCAHDSRLSLALSLHASPLCVHLCCCGRCAHFLSLAAAAARLSPHRRATTFFSAARRLSSLSPPLRASLASPRLLLSRRMRTSRLAVVRASRLCLVSPLLLSLLPVSLLPDPHQFKIILIILLLIYFD